MGFRFIWWPPLHNDLNVSGIVPNINPIVFSFFFKSKISFHTFIFIKPVCQECDVVTTTLKSRDKRINLYLPFVQNHLITPLQKSFWSR